MRASTILATLATAAVTAAVPSSNRGRSVLATFDDIKALPAISQLNPIGIYKGLEYRSLNTLVQGLAGIILTGIVPRSGDQVAANGVTDNLLRGAGPALIPADGNTALDLESLWFGCVVNTVESVTGVPTQCTVAFTAYKPGTDIAFDTINQQYNPENLLRAEMTQAIFPKTWSKMARIEIAVVQSTVTSALTGLLLDDIKYKLY